MKRPQSLSEFLSYFKKDADNKQVASALDRAIAERRFEIELYWKRAAYFWTFIGATFAAYVLLQRLGNDESRQTLSFMVGCLGFLFSLAWHLVNRGSKFWQEFWERNVEFLEDEVMGPLYKVTSDRSQFKWWMLLDAYPFSVTRINNILSIAVAATWILIALIPLFETNMVPVSIVCYTALTIFAAFALTFLGKSSKERDVKFALNVREVIDSDVASLPPIAAKGQEP